MSPAPDPAPDPTPDPARDQTQRPAADPTAALTVEQTPVPGLLVLRLPRHEDARGFFCESWQREKMTALGLPDFGPVQANLSWNASAGATRGLHAEPWDKLVSVATGRAFGAWVDLREGPHLGVSHSIVLEPGVAVFVPRGVANAYQTLTDGVAYTYLVNDHWRPGIAYPALALDDPTAALDWPIPIAEAEVSAKDRANPLLQSVQPVRRPRPLVLGAGGQVGRALLRVLPDAVGLTRDDLDLTDAEALDRVPWSEHDVVINAAAYTAVDAAETPEGRASCWRLNATVPAALARLARERRFRLVHYSTDYVYDGAATVHHESEPVAPLGAYGQAKAAGDLAVLGVDDALVLRTSWVVGEGGNFVQTMARLAAAGVSPRVVDDQVGRLTFADDLARATRHLLDRGARGLVHVSNGGEAASWAGLAREVFALCGRDRADVVPVSTEEYAAGGSMAPRPAHSTLALDELEATGWEPPDQWVRLREWLAATAPVEVR